MTSSLKMDKIVFLLNIFILKLSVCYITLSYRFSSVSRKFLNLVWLVCFYKIIL